MTSLGFFFSSEERGGVGRTEDEKNVTMGVTSQLLRMDPAAACECAKLLLSEDPLEQARGSQDLQDSKEDSPDSNLTHNEQTQKLRGVAWPQVAKIQLECMQHADWAEPTRRFAEHNADVVMELMDFDDAEMDDLKEVLRDSPTLCSDKEVSQVVEFIQCATKRGDTLYVDVYDKDRIAVTIYSDQK